MGRVKLVTGMVAVRSRFASHHARGTEEMHAAGADVVLEPFQDAADRAVKLFCGATSDEGT